MKVWAVAPSDTDVLTFFGSSDASTAVAIGEKDYVVADDENNVLRLYGMRNP